MSRKPTSRQDKNSDVTEKTTIEESALEQATTGRTRRTARNSKTEEIKATRTTKSTEVNKTKPKTRRTSPSKTTTKKTTTAYTTPDETVKPSSKRRSRIKTSKASKDNIARDPNNATTNTSKSTKRTTNAPKNSKLNISISRNQKAQQQSQQKQQQQQKKGLFSRLMGQRNKTAQTYTSVKNRPTRLIFNETSGASSRADFKADKSRYQFIWIVALVLLVILVIRAFELQVFSASFYQEKGNKFITSERKIPTYRGMIIDRNNQALAVSAPLSTVIFNPKQYAKKYYAAKQKIARNPSDSQIIEKENKRLAEMNLDTLAVAANINVQKLKKAANIKEDAEVDFSDNKAVQSLFPTGAGSQYMPLLSKVSPEVAERVLALDFPGITHEQFYQRYYPQSYPNSQLLGFMGENANEPESGYRGRAGLEGKYNETLAGKDGKVLVLRDAKRSILKEIEQIEPEVTGKDIKLTVDLRLQYLLYKELEKIGLTQKAFWSSGMVVDVQTGEVLAISTWPSYNANNLGEMTGENQRNRPLIDSFEPGSVMKPFTVAAALESGQFNKRSMIDTSPGSIKVKGYTIRDHENLGRINFATLLKKSSNVASTKIALKLPANSITNMQRKFGFGNKTALEFPSETNGIVTTPKKKQTARRATLSYGYGLQVSLAQVAQAYATLGAGGVLHPLTLVQSDKPNESKQVISRENAQAVVEMMEGVTEEDGTAPSAAINGFRVAGKTGTSRRVNPEGGYFKDKYRTVFAGIAPVSNPRLVVAILVENPQKNKYAGEVAAPVFHNVMQEALRLYNVPLDKPLLVHE